MKKKHENKKYVIIFATIFALQIQCASIPRAESPRADTPRPARTYYSNRSIFDFLQNPQGGAIKAGTDSGEDYIDMPNLERPPHLIIPDDEDSISENNAKTEHSEISDTDTELDCDTEVDVDSWLEHRQAEYSSGLEPIEV